MKLLPFLPLVHGLEHWLYSSQVADALQFLDRPDVVGVQGLYSWKSLESAEGVYNFSAIESDIETVTAKGKKLWVQLQDRTFNPANDPVPSYMKTPGYNNGSAPTCDGETCDTDFEVSGWMAQQWNPRVRQRFQALLSAMASQLDGRIYGINLAETSISVDTHANNYTDASYFYGELENAGHAAAAFNASYVVQYVNFWPDGWANANSRFNTSFDYYASHGVGVGGPDLIPFQRGQESNSYPFIAAYRDRVPISVVAVQEPDLEKINPHTGRLFTKDEFVDYAKGLGVRIIFWATAAPWLAT
ncbi:hypothetical protein VFPFJ_09225 [Purpureocillium lilacinum]|uniref:Uncharacterized protein n=1 Tax=Purpureocillium lilacinum TaxID=33203 RepID=A0A179GU30_PURLI|nr:hypothetical protein VFPFJ_09225 [Purpureocillium lilacinum]OAQ80771.1 hypothetical protein VFPFJ_09225 [Purpureocillium lilacinum]